MADVIPTQKDCDELAEFLHDWAHRFQPHQLGGAKVWMLAHEIVDSVGYHEVTRDGFHLPDECYAEKVQKVIKEKWST